MSPPPTAVAGPSDIRLDLPQAPRQVLLFSGHLVDAPDRKEPRFPAGKVPVAARR